MSPPPEQITAVVLAGGFGARIKHLLGDLPKPMAPVEGRPFVEWVVCYLAGQGVRRVILSTGFQAETVAHHFQSHPLKSVSVRCVPETQPLGTGGGFLNVARGGGESPAAWLVLNGDSLALAPLQPVFDSLAQPEIEGAVLGVRVPDASRFGTLAVNARGELAGFREKQPGAGVVNAGVYLFPAPTVGTFPIREPLSFETDVFPSLAARGARVKVCVTGAPFLDIGTPESLPQAGAFVRRHADWFKHD